VRPIRPLGGFMASTWYRTGTITVTNGSASVTGSGTQFVTSNIRIGDALHAPDGRVYEVTAVASATQITITPAYLGGTASGQDYAIQPTRGIVQALYTAISNLTGSVEGYLGGVLSGLFPDGSTVAPSISFASQPDHGRYINAEGNMTDVEGGQEVIEFTPTDIEIKRQLTGAAVQSSGTDTTAGRVLQLPSDGRGTFGLGATEFCNSWPNSSINDVSDVGAGFYRTDSGVADCPPGYTGAVIIYGIRFKDAAQFTQLLIAPSGRMTVRGSSGGTPGAPTWGDFREVFTTGDVLGTVSQSGGDPTGAIIERGSNANGEYVRFADGTQICTANVTASLTSTVAFQGGFRSSGQTADFPAAFISVPTVSAFVDDASAFGAVAHASTPVGGWRWAAVTVDSQGTAATRDVHLTAIGRWF